MKTEGKIFIHNDKKDFRKLVLTGVSTPSGVYHYITNSGIVGTIHMETLENKYSLLAEYPTWIEAVGSKEFSSFGKICKKRQNARALVGKLCWFWNAQKRYKVMGVLKGVDDDGYYVKSPDLSQWENCCKLDPEELKKYF